MIQVDSLCIPEATALVEVQVFIGPAGLIAARPFFSATYAIFACRSSLGAPIHKLKLKNLPLSSKILPTETDIEQYEVSSFRIVFYETEIQAIPSEL